MWDDLNSWGGGVGINYRRPHAALTSPLKPPASISSSAVKNGSSPENQGSLRTSDPQAKKTKPTDEEVEKKPTDDVWRRFSDDDPGLN